MLRRVVQCFRRWGLLLKFFTLMACVSWGQANADSSIPITGRSNPDLMPLDDLMTSFLDREGLPGAALAVMRHGQLYYARGFGYADRETRRPVQPDSLFRIASLSKPITAVAVLQLVERGTIRLDDAAFTLLKPQPSGNDVVDSRLWKITIRQLLQHTGGWDRDASFDPMFRSVTIADTLHVRPPARPGHIIQYMLSRPLDFAPGQRYAYSNFGYCVLGRIIESVTGQRYEDYIKKNVLLPLRITRMQIGHSRLSDAKMGEVTYYTRHDTTQPSVFPEDLGRPVPSQYGGWYLEAMDAHGGWIASAIDLVQFASALDGDSRIRLLSRSGVETLFAPPSPPVGRDAQGRLAATYYACGWQVRPIDGRGRNTWHAGGLPGTSTLLVRRHDGFCWAVLFNMRESVSGTDAASLIDPLVHQAVDRVKHWPKRGILLK